MVLCDSHDLEPELPRRGGGCSKRALWAAALAAVRTAPRRGAVACLEDHDSSLHTEHVPNIAI